MTTQWEIEPHTLAKHEILRRYLSAWYPILSTYNPRIVYLDGFCGPGRYKGGEDGSPIIALREALKYSQRLKNNEITFLFVDERADRIAHLNAELNNCIYSRGNGQRESGFADQALNSVKSIYAFDGRSINHRSQSSISIGAPLRTKTAGNFAVDN